MERHDFQRLEHIVDYCEDIEDALARMNHSYEDFLADKMAQYAVAFSILQIGELVSKLSEELRTSTHSEIDWPAVKGMRNIIAHALAAPPRDFAEMRDIEVLEVTQDD